MAIYPFKFDRGRLLSVEVDDSGCRMCVGGAGFSCTVHVLDGDRPSASNARVGSTVGYYYLSDGTFAYAGPCAHRLFGDFFWPPDSADPGMTLFDLAALRDAMWTARDSATRLRGIAGGGAAVRALDEHIESVEALLRVARPNRRTDCGRRMTMQDRRQECRRRDDIPSSHED